MTRTLLLAGTFVLAAAAGVLHFADSSPVAIFVVAGLAIAALAWIVSSATESVGARYGPAVTGVLQSTLGNLPELFIVLFAISVGDLLVARTAVLGSLFEGTAVIGSLVVNALLVLGVASLAGACHARDGVMRFEPRLPNDTFTLMMLAVFIIVLVGISHEVDDRASEHDVTISAICAVLLLSVYAVWLVGYLRGGAQQMPTAESPMFSFRTGLALLAAGGLASALVADWFVDSLDGAIESLGI